MSLNDTTFHVIAQTPTPHPQNKTFQCSLLPIVLLLRDTFSKPVFSISKIHHKFDHSLPSTLFLAQCNRLLPCFPTFTLASKRTYLKANYMIPLNLVLIILLHSSKLLQCTELNSLCYKQFPTHGGWNGREL